MTCPPHHEFVVWWYGQFLKNPFGHKLPHVEVLLRRLRPDGEWGEYHLQSFGITSIPLLRIGSIWRDKTSSSQLAFKRREFRVDFSDGAFDFTSLGEHLAKHKVPLFPDRSYTLLNHSENRSQILRFRAEQGETVLIPAVEFFARCYGRSGKANRILSQYPFDDAVAMMVSTAAASTPGMWSIKIHPGLYFSDSVLLAHLLFDPDTKRRVKSIYAGLESLNRGKKPPSDQVPGQQRAVSRDSSPYWAISETHAAYPRIAPWFTGPARLQVEGIPIDTKTFLALRITGCTQPKGRPIEVERDAALRALDDDYDDEAAVGAGTFPQHSAVRRNDVAKLNDLTAAGKNTETREILDPTFKVLGEERSVTVRTRHVETDKDGRKPRPADEAEEYSGAERSGRSSSKTGAAAHHSPLELERFGTLWAVWGGLRHWAAEHSKLLTSLSWYTSEHGFVKDSEREPFLEPLPIDLDRPDDEAGDPIRPRSSWGTLREDAEVVPRGVLIARVCTPTSQIFVLELQRRTRVGERGLVEEVEDFCGLVFSVENQGDVAPSWLQSLLKAILDGEGVMKKALPYCTTHKRSDFSHQPTRKLKPGHAWARNALGKMGIVLPRPAESEDEKRRKAQASKARKVPSTGRGTPKSDPARDGRKSPKESNSL